MTWSATRCACARTGSSSARSAAWRRSTCSRRSTPATRARWSTVHANSADDALFRLETLATMSDLTVPHHALREYINSAIHVIVQTERGPDGARRVVEVAVVASTPGRAVPAPERDALRGRTDRTRSPGHWAAPALRAPRTDHAAIDALGGTPPAGVPARRRRSSRPNGRPSEHSRRSAHLPRRCCCCSRPQWSFCGASGCLPRARPVAASWPVALGSS